MVPGVHGGLGPRQVIQEGTYVAMIASAEHQEEIADAFEGLFA